MTRIEIATQLLAGMLANTSPEYLGYPYSCSWMINKSFELADELIKQTTENPKELLCRSCKNITSCESFIVDMATECKEYESKNTNEPT